MRELTLRAGDSFTNIEKGLNAIIEETKIASPSPSALKEIRDIEDFLKVLRDDILPEELKKK